MMDNETSTAALTKEYSIGELLHKAGKIKVNDVERIMALQKQQGLLFGEAAKALGLVSDVDVRNALATQFHFTILSADDNSVSQELLAAYQPFSPEIEKLRALREQLKQRLNQENKSIAVLSPDRGEGRSWLTANLAIVFSQLGYRTLIVDADLRQPRQQKLFKLKNVPGLADILAERSDFQTVQSIASFKDLFVLSAGTLAPNSIELLSKGLKSVLQQLERQYDIILVDSPALAQSIEAEIIAGSCGSALLLARMHETRLEKLQLTKDALEGAGVILLGAILSEF